jgi:biopolymer transport protein ExbD
MALPAVALTALLDVLLVTNAFALAVAQAPSGCLCVTPRIDAPSAYEVTDLPDAPMVTIDAEGHVEVDGQRVEAPSSTSGGSDPLPELTALLGAQRDLARQLQPDRALQRGVVLNFDKDTPAHLVKLVVSAAARAGYAGLSFMVKRRFDEPYTGSDAVLRLRDKLRDGPGRRVW